MSMDSTLPCYSGSYTLLAAFVLVVWGILPFLVTCCCLKKYKSKGETGSDSHDLLQDHYDEDADFRIKYGWAITKYRIKMNDADEERLDWFQNIVDEEFIKETHSGNKKAAQLCKRCCGLQSSGNQTVTKTRGKKYGKCCRCW